MTSWRSPARPVRTGSVEALLNLRGPLVARAASREEQLANPPVPLQALPWYVLESSNRLCFRALTRFSESGSEHKAELKVVNSRKAE